MDWSLVIFITVIVFFAYRGYRKGLLKSLSRVISLVAGYIAAILYTRQFSTVVETQTPLEGLVALATASVLLFFVAALAVSLIFWLIGITIPERTNSTTTSSIGGATVGLLTGVIVSVIIVWGFAFLRDMQTETELAESVKPNKSTIESIVNRAASKAVKTALSLADAKPAITQMSAALIESPGEIAQQAKRLAGSKDLSALLGDPENQAVLNSGDVEAVKALPAFQQLVNNPDMQALAKSAGMLNQSADSSASVDAALADQLTDIWARMQRVKNDQRVQEILSNPEFQKKVQSGNPLDLMTNARLLELADIIFEDKGNGAIEESGDNSFSKQEKAIFSWIDENGKIHYSDKEAE